MNRYEAEARAEANADENALMREEWKNAHDHETGAHVAPVVNCPPCDEARKAGEATLAANAKAEAPWPMYCLSCQELVVVHARTEAEAITKHNAGHEAERQNDKDADELARYIELRAEVMDYMTSQSARGCRSGGSCDLSYRSCSPCWANNLLARVRGTA